MSDDLVQARLDRRAEQARDRRRRRGLKTRGGSGRGQGRKMKDIPDRPSCCDRLMVSIGKSWRCPVCKITIRKIKEQNDG